MPSVKAELIGKDANGQDVRIVLRDPASLYASCRNLGLPTHWFGKPNSFTSKLGREPGMGYVLMTVADKNKIDLNSYEHSLVLSIDNNEFTFADLTIITAEAVAAGDRLTDDTVLLVHLADKRWYGRMTSASNVQYNVLVGATRIEEGSINSSTGDPWTWEEMAEDLWDNYLPADIFGAFPGFPASFINAYDLDEDEDSPLNQLFNGKVAWEVINDVLESLGLAVQMKRDGTFEIVDLAEDDAAVDAVLVGARASLALDISLATDSEVSKIPERVEVIFPYRGQDEPRLTRGTTYSLLAASNNANAIPGTRIPVHSVVAAVANSAGTIQNATRLGQIRDRIATQLLDSLAKSETQDEVFTGYLDIDPSVAGSVMWYDIGGGPKTKVKQETPLFLPESNDDLLLGTQFPPVFGGMWGAGGGPSTTSTTPVKIDWSTFIFKANMRQYNMTADYATDLLTASIKGIYRVEGAVRMFRGASTESGSLSIYYVNAVAYYPSSSVSSNLDLGSKEIRHVDYIELNVGDTLELHWNSGTGNTINLQSGFFRMELVLPT